jgi:hypothetical protein
MWMTRLAAVTVDAESRTKAILSPDVTEVVHDPRLKS